MPEAVLTMVVYENPPTPATLRLPHMALYHLTGLGLPFVYLLDLFIGVTQRAFEYFIGD